MSDSLWYHGSRFRFSTFDHDPVANGDDERGRHWNARLGIHFAPSFSQAAIFCEQYPYDLTAPTPAALGQVVTARLRLSNPLCIADERLLSLALLAHLLASPTPPDISTPGPYYIMLAAQKVRSEIDLAHLQAAFAPSLASGLAAFSSLTSDPSSDLLDEVDLLADYHSLRLPAARATFLTRLLTEGYDGILYGNFWDEALRSAECALVFAPSQISILSIDPVGDLSPLLLS